MNGYIEEVVKNIENKRLKKQIARELEDHILEKTDHYRSLGLTADEAQKRAIKDMGENPEEIGQQLSELHPFSKRHPLEIVIWVIFLAALFFFSLFIVALNDLTYNNSSLLASLFFLFVFLGYYKVSVWLQRPEWLAHASLSLYFAVRHCPGSIIALGYALKFQLIPFLTFYKKYIFMNPPDILQIAFSVLMILTVLTSFVYVIKNKHHKNTRMGNAVMKFDKHFTRILAIGFFLLFIPELIFAVGDLYPKGTEIKNIYSWEFVFSDEALTSEALQGYFREKDEDLPTELTGETIYASHDPGDSYRILYPSAPGFFASTYSEHLVEVQSGFFTKAEAVDANIDTTHTYCTVVPVYSLDSERKNHFAAIDNATTYDLRETKHIHLTEEANGIFLEANVNVFKTNEPPEDFNFELTWTDEVVFADPPAINTFSSASGIFTTRIEGATPEEYSINVELPPEIRAQIYTRLAAMEFFNTQKDFRLPKTTTGEDGFERYLCVTHLGENYTFHVFEGNYDLKEHYGSDSEYIPIATSYFDAINIILTGLEKMDGWEDLLLYDEHFDLTKLYEAYFDSFLGEENPQLDLIEGENHEQY